MKEPLKRMHFEFLFENFFKKKLNVILFCVAKEKRQLDVYDDNEYSLVSLSSCDTTVPAWQSLIGASMLPPPGDVALRQQCNDALTQLQSAPGTLID